METITGYKVCKQSGISYVTGTTAIYICKLRTTIDMRWGIIKMNIMNEKMR